MATGACQDSEIYQERDASSKADGPKKREKSRHLEDFLAVSDFIVDNDPAVLSYLSGEEVNIARRVCKH